MAGPNPICFQTSTYGGMGGTASDLTNTLNYAVALGARSIELPLGYTALSATALGNYNSLLLANDVSRTLGSGPPPPPPATSGAFTGKLGTSLSQLGNIVLGTPRSSASYQTQATETVLPSSDAILSHLVLLRGVSESIPPAFDIMQGITGGFGEATYSGSMYGDALYAGPNAVPTTVTSQYFTRTTLEIIPQANDAIQTIAPSSPSTFLSTVPLPMYGVVLDANLNFVETIPTMLTRPVLKSAINGGFQPVTIDLPASDIVLQNGFIVQLFEGNSPIAGQHGDGTIIFQGVIENLPDTYDTDPNHQVTISPMVVFLGSTSYTASWNSVDIAVIVRDIVSQCPYLKFAPQSIQNISNQGNLISAEDASFEAGTTGHWEVGSQSGILGNRLAQPGLLELGVATDANCTIGNIGFVSGAVSGVLGVGLLGAFPLGTAGGTVQQAPGTDGSHALLMQFTSSTAPANPRSNLHLDGIPVAGGGTYTALASLRAVGLARSWYMQIEWQDVNEQPISTVSGSTVTEVGALPIQAFVTATAPANANGMRIYVVVVGALVGESHILDQVSVAANILQVWTPGYTPGSNGTATLSFDHVSALQALTTCIQAAGPYYYFFVDEVGVVWLSRLDPASDATFQLAQGAQFGKRDFSAPIDTLCNFIEVVGGNVTYDVATTLSTPIAATSDVATTANAIFNVALWNSPPGLFTIQIDAEQMQVRGYGDNEIAGAGDRSIQIYQRGYAGTPVQAHAIGTAVIAIGLTPNSVPLTAFYDGTNGTPKRELIPPGVYSNCYDAPTLQSIANTLGQWLNRKVISTQLTLPNLGKRIKLNSQLGVTVSYWEPSVNPLLESYHGTGLATPPLLVTDVEVDGGVQRVMLSDLPFTSEDLQYFVDNMLQNSMVVAAGALQADAAAAAATVPLTGVTF